MVKGSSSPWYGSSPAAFEKESAMQASDFAPLHNASAEAVMTGDQPERRWKKRTLVRLPVWIQLPPRGTRIPKLPVESFRTLATWRCDEDNFFAKPRGCG